MKKLNLIVLLGCMGLLLNACSKSTTTDDTTEGNWVKRSTLDGAARSFGVAFSIGNFGYVGTGLSTGINGTDVLSDFWRYDPSSDSWSQMASIPVGRMQAVAFTISNIAYVGTGADKFGTTFYNDFYAYDPASNTWTQKANYAGSARSRATAFAIGNTGYVTCGYDGTYYKDMYSYNPATDSWQSDISMGGDKRVGAMAFVYNNEGYVVGGTNSGGQATTDFYKFNPSADKWFQLRSITNATDSSFDDDYTDIVRTSGVAFVLGNLAYITTGQNATAGTYNNNTWCYDPSSDTWTRRTAYERATRWGAVSFVVDNRAFVGTGATSGSQPYDNFDEFIPSETYNAND